MPSPPVHHVDIRAFCYATEVPDRVEAALRAIYPPLDGDGEPAIVRTTTEGHYGHRIDIFEARLSTADEVRTVFERLRARGDLDQLATELDERVTDENELYLRLDKQAAFADGDLVFGDGIEVSMKLEAYPAKREAAIENISAYLDELRAEP